MMRLLSDRNSTPLRRCGLRVRPDPHRKSTYAGKDKWREACFHVDVFFTLVHLGIIGFNLSGWL